MRFLIISSSPRDLGTTVITLLLMLLTSFFAYANTKEVFVKPGVQTTTVVAFFVTGLSGCTPVAGMTGQITVQPAHGMATIASGTYTTPSCPGVSFPGVEADYKWTDVAGQPGSGSDAFHVHFIAPPGHPQTVDYDIYIAEGSPTKILGNCDHCSGDQSSTSIPGQAYAGDPANPGAGGSFGQAPSSSAPGPGLVRRVNSGSGNLFQQATDYTTVGENPLAFTRYYNSQGSTTSFATHFVVISGNPAAGARWRNNFDRYISILNSSVVAVERSSGQMLSFFANGTAWTSQTDVDGSLTKSGTAWTFTDSDDNVETFSQTALGPLETNVARLTSIKKRNGYTQTLNYNGAGQVISVTDSYGRALTFTYNSDGTLTTLITPDNTVISYGYTAVGFGRNLTSVTYSTVPPSTLTYLYENAGLPNALTGTIDENGNRYATWGYDTSGRVTSSQLGTGANAELTSMAYNANGTTTVTNALGVADTYTFTTLQFVPKVSQISRAATSTTPAMTRSFTYDANGFTASETDWNGNQTTYVNNTRGLPTTINEAVGKSGARTTTIAYSTAFPHLPATITTPGVTASFTYDTGGNTLTRTLTDTTTTTVPYSTKGQARTRTFTYDATGHVLTAKNPRADVSAITTFAYDASGTLASVTDALNHVTIIASHTGGGLPLTVVDPNNVTTTFTYDGRQRLTSSSLTTGAGALTTSYAIDAASELTQVTLPDTSFHAFAYDSAHRVTQVTDALNNAMQLTPNALGKTTQVNVFNSSNALRFQHSSTFDALGRKLTDVAGAGQTTTLAYDNNGNALTTKDGLNHQTTQAFDGLNRLLKITDANAGITSFVYDTHDRATSVTDATSHVTSYVYDGFGDLIQQASPDSGTTVFHYDPDGNLTSKTDALGVFTNYAYDALDRVLTRSYPADATQNVTFTYDQSGGSFGFGVGRLGTMTDAAGFVNLGYDERGNVIRNKRFSGSGVNLSNVFNAYDQANRITNINYPSGINVSYNRDAVGNVWKVTVQTPNSTAFQTVAFPAFKPFGPLYFLTFGNNEAEGRQFDLDYRTQQVTDTNTAGVNLMDLTYTYDAANNVKSIADSLNPGNRQTFGYDVLNRLTSAVSGTGGYGSLAWSYDKNGNLLTRTVGTASTTYAYTAGTNRIASYTLAGVTTTVATNANGNITSIPPASSSTAATFAYNVANRLASVSGSPLGANFVYDGFGQRYSKGNPGSTPITYTYDQDRNLIEENNNSAVTDYIYLNGVPVAIFVPNGGAGTVYYVHTDQLGTPQLVTDNNQAPAWSTTYQPYGTTGVVNASITQNLRLPGQYFDSETGFHYNGFRDYVPGLGRYLETDPIGLAGGGNTYTYTGQRPFTFTDRWGTSPNNVIIGNTFDSSLWCLIGTVGENDDALTFNAGTKIAIEASSVAGPVATNQFRFTVIASPLSADGTLQPSMATPQWSEPVNYSSGFTGNSAPNQFVIRANPIPAPLVRWAISLPPQEETHDNSDFKTLNIYKPGPCSCGDKP
ncbi:MAG TPA: RHS repeat-associated core domain-containing protein [Terracidiphilus sp.]|jgi:RHS repeat-associated protein